MIVVLVLIDALDISGIRKGSIHYCEFGERKSRAQRQQGGGERVNLNWLEKTGLAIFLVAIGFVIGGTIRPNPPSRFHKCYLLTAVHVGTRLETEDCVGTVVKVGEGDDPTITIDWSSKPIFDSIKQKTWLSELNMWVRDGSCHITFEYSGNKAEAE